ncbi:NAD(P)H-dependent oxidoreductase [Utexia brackfieldae]|uniref:NAD(P)H-dependent oxidoreductase n=1 Tax=Utexia brackfieldae TaxID=3074108 RepID=UPI00370DD2A5
MKTLVITSHPYPAQSRVIKALQQTAEATDNITVRNLESLYGHNTNQFDIEAEKRAYADIDRVIFLFPIHWFNVTPMLKAYLNEVWQYGWAFGPHGTALQGKEMLVVTTTGATEHTYSADGLTHSTIDEVLTPMRATASYVGMTYSTPLVFFGVVDADEKTIKQYQKTFSKRLQQA